MAITIKDLSPSTQYALLKDKAGRKERIKTYIDGINSKYPTTQARITQFWKDNQGDYDKLTGITPDTTFTQFFNKFNGEQDIIDKVKPEHIKQIGELLKESPGDSDLLKELKATARDKAGEISDYYDNADGGITWGDFLIDLITNYYLKNAPIYINKELADNNLLLSDLDKDKWTKAKSDLFNNVYSTFTDDKQESDLDPLLKGLNEGIGNIKNLIIETRQKKESDRDGIIKALNEQIKTLTANQLTDDQKQKLKDYTTLEEARDNWKKKAEDTLKELTKANDDNAELIKAGGEVSKTIKKLEEENKNLKQQLANKPQPTPQPNGNQQPQPTPTFSSLQQELALMIVSEGDWSGDKLEQRYSQLLAKYPNYESRQQIHDFFNNAKRNMRELKARMAQINLW